MEKVGSGGKVEVEVEVEVDGDRVMCDMSTSGKLNDLAEFEPFN
jgi:hypothetical protein